MPQFVRAEEAVSKILDDAVLWIEGSSGGLNDPGALYEALRQQFESKGQPRNLTIIHSNGIGDGKGKGIDLLAKEGLIKRSIAGHYAFSPNLVRLINEQKIQGYNLPQGVIAQLAREIAAGRPGLVTKVGLHTFVDPRQSGGALNSISKESFVEMVKIRNEEYLFYPSLPIHVVFLRGSAADEDGNISMEDEAVYLNGLAAAQAGHNSGGIVIAQVKRNVKRGSLDPRFVKIPGILIDYIVVDENQWQTYDKEYNPALCGAARIVVETDRSSRLDERKIIARRAAMELVPGVINLGVGIPSEVAAVATKEGLESNIVLTVEHGVVGGIPVSGTLFGCAMNPHTILDQPYQFDFYDGGGVDKTFLGLAQVDKEGNVNVSKFGQRIAGCGGFINITQGAKSIVYCGTFTAVGLKVSVESGRLNIKQEGSIKKFVDTVEQITFSGRLAKQHAKPVMLITERAVFKLIPEGVILTEIAPGIDVEKDILAYMDFSPIISTHLKEMDPRIFKPDHMGIKNEVLLNSK